MNDITNTTVTTITSFVIYMEPVAQGRPRFAKRGQFMQAYDPKKSRDFKSMFFAAAQQHRPERPIPRGTPVFLTVNIYRSIPKSFSKKKQKLAEDKELRPTQKPDLDNYIKGIKDGMRDVFWENDSQVVDTKSAKYYSINPRIEVEVRR